MTEPRQIAVVREYSELIAALRGRCDDLNISRETLDDITGLQSGYSAKLLAQVTIRNLGPVSLGPMLQALGLSLLVVEDPDSEARFATQRKEKTKVMLSGGKHGIAVVQISHRKLGLMARRGGKKRAAKLTAKRRATIASLAAKARWKRERDKKRRQEERRRATARAAAGSTRGPVVQIELGASQSQPC